MIYNCNYFVYKNPTFYDIDREYIPHFDYIFSEDDVETNKTDEDIVRAFLKHGVVYFHDSTIFK